MSEKLNIRLLIIPFMVLISTFGCIPQTKKVVVTPPKPPAVSPPAPLPVLPADMIDKKIVYLTHLLEEKKLDEEDREIALNLLSAYKMIRSQENTTRYDDRKIIHALFANLSQLDEKYFLKEKVEEKLDSDVVTFLSLKRKKILDDFLSEDYQRVINDCLELEAIFGPDSLTPEIGVFFAVSLAKKGMLKEAVSIGERIARELEGSPDLIHLRANIIQWQLDLGEKEKAQEGLEKLMDNLDEREAVFSKTMAMVTGRDQKIASREEMPAEGLSTEGSPLQETDPMEELLRRVDELIQEHEFKEAKLRLIRERLRVQEVSKIETIDHALKTVEMAEEGFEKEKNSELTQEKETIELAKKLIEEEHFEEAISKLEELKGDQDTAAEVKALKDLAIEKYINQERNRAAKLFLKARRTTDQARKEELLLSSYEILEALIEKYPTSNLVAKLNDHIGKVREELGKLGIEPQY
jgi:hypothetical protein